MRKKMKSQLNKILIVTLVILFFSLSKSYSIEDVTEFTDAINEAREGFNNSPEASTEQSKIIDEALKEIDKATEYAQEAINRDNAEDAIKTLEFIEKTLTDVQSIIPQEFGSDMSKMDISAIPKEDMDIITEVPNVADALHTIYKIPSFENFYWSIVVVMGSFRYRHSFSVSLRCGTGNTWCQN